MTSEVCERSNDCYRCLGMFKGNCWFNTYEAQFNRYLNRLGRVNMELEAAEKRKQHKTTFDIGVKGKFQQLKPLKNDKYLIKYKNNLLGHLLEARLYFEKRVKERDVEYAVLHKKLFKEIPGYTDPMFWY